MEVVMRPVVVCCCAMLASIAILDPQSSFAQWRSDSLTNTPVATAKHAQTHPKIASDGAGGAFIVWQDIRTTHNWDVYAQHIDATGKRLWGDGGIVICNAAYDQYSPLIAADGYGGAFIVWEDQRSAAGSDIYAQHLNADGDISFEANGIAIGQANGVQTNAAIALTKPGKLVVAFEDNRSTISSSRPDITLNTVTRQGALYGTNGWEVITSQGGQRQPRLMADNKGFALLAWQSDHGLPGGVHASLLDSNGAMKWNPGGNSPGLQIYKGPSAENFAGNIGLGLSGDKFLMAWEVQNISDNLGKDIFANRLSRSGEKEWFSAIEITGEWPGDQTEPMITADDSGGFIVAFQDFPSDVSPRFWNKDIVVVRIRSNGSDRVPAYGESPLSIVKQSRAQTNAQMIEADGRLYFAWDDARHATDDTAIYAQQIDRSLTKYYPAPGTSSSWGKPIAVRTDAQQEHVTMCKREGGGVILAWTDNRNGDQDIYAQVLFKDGTLPIELTSFDVQAFGSKVIVEWHTASEKDHAGYEVERRNVSTGESYRVIESYKQSDLLKGHGDRKDASSYAIEDDPAPGIYEYRIADVALDGTRSTHRAKKINTSYAAPLEWKVVSAFPNPTNEKLTLQMQFAEDATARVEVRDQLGRVVLTSESNPSQRSRYIELNTSGLPSGAYYYTVSATKDGAHLWTSGMNKFQVIR